jgi:hypothetical protein
MIIYWFLVWAKNNKILFFYIKHKFVNIKPFANIINSEFTTDSSVFKFLLAYSRLVSSAKRKKEKTLVLIWSSKFKDAMYMHCWVCWQCFWWTGNEIILVLCAGAGVLAVFPTPEQNFVCQIRSYVFPTSQARVFYFRTALQQRPWFPLVMWTPKNYGNKRS